MLPLAFSFLVGINRPNLFPRKTKKAPQIMSNTPRNAAAPIITWLWNTLFTSVAPVADKKTIMSTIKPENETKPPNAIFNRSRVDSVDKFFDQLWISRQLEHNCFVIPLDPIKSSLFF